MPTRKHRSPLALLAVRGVSATVLAGDARVIRDTDGAFSAPFGSAILDRVTETRKS